MAQPGVYGEPTRFGWFLEFDVGDVDAMAAALTTCREGCALIAFGAPLWRRLEVSWAPAALAPFRAVAGQRHRAPATQRDLLAWIADDDFAEAFDRARALVDALGRTATLVEETLGFDYRASHDLIGFEDGTANPEGDARREAAEVPADEPGGGGSYVFTQKWVHDLHKFNALDVAEQERVVGRTKSDSVELEGDAMPPTSHVSRTDLKVDGVAQKIWRRSMPYGTPSRHGLYFFAFARAPSRIQVQLESMYDVAGSGVYDHLLDFSQAVSGSYWFAPAEDDLSQLLGRT
jgi:putative iron-dependent peroxidase